MNSAGLPRILIVDDSSSLRRAFAFFLADHGYQTSEAADGLEALALLADATPDLMLLDLGLPRMDGLTLLAELQRQGRELPTIIVSGDGDSSKVIAALRSGAWDYLLKPFDDLEILLHAVEQAFERIRLLQVERSYKRELEQEVERQTGVLRRQQQEIELRARQSELIARLSQQSLRPIPMETFLSEVLCELLQNGEWLGLEERGSIFLVEAEGQEHTEKLTMMASQNLPPEILEQCRQVAFGHCLCGKAASSAESLFAQHLDEQPGVATAGNASHGHAILPIKQGDQLLGLLNLYRPATPEESPPAIDFLSRCTDIIGLGISRHQAEAEIEYQAFHDVLTGLANRRLLADRLHSELLLSQRHGLQGALLFLDLDNFKTFNDSLGHNAGDTLLKEIANRLRQAVREGDTVARLGGDEFIVLLPSIAANERETARGAEVVALKLKADLSRPYLVEGEEYLLTASIGIVVYPEGGDSSTLLLSHADAAMFQAKKEGRNTIRFFNQAMHSLADERLKVEHDLRRALTLDQFEPYYQPQYDQNGRLISAEVLLRWLHPERGWVSPAEFIPVAEESGLIVPIGEWLFHEVCRRRQRWSDQGLAIGLESIAVNISPNQFHEANFVAFIRHELEALSESPDWLVLEITEGVLLQDQQGVIDKMQTLKALGLRFSIDDFGTGYSSLAYLKDLPLDELKIDQSFVKGVDQNEHNQMIVQTILSMAQNLRLNVVAEGVETEEELGFLLGIGCNHFQGFHFNRPLPESELLRLLQQGGNGNG